MCAVIADGREVRHCTVFVPFPGCISLLGHVVADSDVLVHRPSSIWRGNQLGVSRLGMVIVIDRGNSVEFLHMLFSMQSYVFIDSRLPSGAFLYEAIAY